MILTPTSRSSSPSTPLLESLITRLTSHLASDAPPSTASSIFRHCKTSSLLLMCIFPLNQKLLLGITGYFLNKKGSPYPLMGVYPQTHV